jgi:hypothetical protein
MAAEGDKKIILSSFADDNVNIPLTEGERTKWMEKARSLDFYDAESAPISQSGRTLLEEYSNIPADRVEEHAQEVVS